MGMFDDIIVPKSYLKSLLTKEQEKLVEDNNYQTKSLENFLGQYKVYRQKLFVKENKEWVKDTRSGKIIFYTSFYDKDDNTWWREFKFTFKSGVLDKKELIKFEMQETAEEAKEREKEWKVQAAKRRAFERTFKYRFYEKIRVLLTPILNWVEKQTRMPSPNRVDRQRIIKKREKLSLWKHF
tara:strand:+ start:179 stop:724 length:546 start_codon:yes stop_codon:yes gene_type:complete